MRTAHQAQLALPSGLFGSNSYAYDPLEPFLAVAAAAVEVNHHSTSHSPSQMSSCQSYPNHNPLQAYSAYYDSLVCREAVTHRLAFYPTPSSLAMAIIGSTGTSGSSPPFSGHHLTESDILITDNRSAFGPVLPSVPTPSPPFAVPTFPSPQSDLYAHRIPVTTIPEVLDSCVETSVTVDCPRSLAKRNRGGGGGQRTRVPQSRLQQSWPCSCSGLIDEDTEHVGCISPHSDHILSDESLNSNSTLPPFECAKSFIRRRNARERERVRCVNAGYDALRKQLPLAAMPDRRLAKVEILRGAINYINDLKQLLGK